MLEHFGRLSLIVGVSLLLPALANAQAVAPNFRELRPRGKAGDTVWVPDGTGAGGGRVVGWGSGGERAGGEARGFSIFPHPPSSFWPTDPAASLEKAT